MKNTILFIILGGLLITNSSFAQSHSRSRSYSPPPTYSAPATNTMSTSSESSFSPYDYTWGVGLASATNIVYLNQAALTGVYNFSSDNMIQAYLVMDQVAGVGVNGLGAVFKHTISGNSGTGLHVGGGLGLGKYSDTKNFLHIVGIGGFHFPMHKKVSVHIDGGLTLTNDDHPSNTSKDSNLLLGGMSNLLGVSLIYML